MTYDERKRMAAIVEVMQFAVLNSNENPYEAVKKLTEILEELKHSTYSATKAA